MTSKPLPWSDLPEEVKARLRDREKAQRRETKRRGLPAESVSVEALWLLQDGFCGCPKGEACGPLNPAAVHGDDDHIVIGHDEARRFERGHTKRNVILQRADCNRKQSGQENTWQRRQTKFIPDPARTREEAKPKRKSSIQSRGFQQRPKGHVSPLSKEGRARMKERMK